MMGFMVSVRNASFKGGEISAPLSAFWISLAGHQIFFSFSYNLVQISVFFCFLHSLLPFFVLGFFFSLIIFVAFWLDLIATAPIKRKTGNAKKKRNDMQWKDQAGQNPGCCTMSSKLAFCFAGLTVYCFHSSYRKTVKKWSQQNPKNPQRFWTWTSRTIWTSKTGAVLFTTITFLWFSFFSDYLYWNEKIKMIFSRNPDAPL